MVKKNERRKRNEWRMKINEGLEDAKSSITRE
jgi:hypothetical protein